MSLLLEALKKAELAKQAAKVAGQSRPPAMELQLEPELAEPVITREKLPDISQPLDISTEDLPSSQAASPAPAPEPTPIAPPPPPPPAQAVRPAPEEQPEAVEDSVFDGPAPLGAGREAAKQLFEVKEINYNPKRPFYITLTLLGLCAVGYGGYLWWQLQPKSLAYNPNAVKDGAAPAAAPPPASAETPPPAPAPGPASQTAAGAIAQQPGATATAPPPALPAGTAKAVPAPSGSEATAARSQTGRALPTTRGPSANPEPEADPSTPRFKRSAPPARPPSEASAGRAPRGVVSIQRGAPSIDPSVARAYEAYNAGDLTSARSGYEQALQRDPRNRDALLGLAAIDQRTGNPDMADLRYQRLLEIDPRDSQALAGQLSLRSQNDPVQTESRIKSLLASQPEAAHLRFALGNQYAQQGRWSEAQPEYFRAWTADPENPDYAFNLAVSLDQMRQPKLALEYYQKALALAQKRPAAFNAAQAAARVQQLQR